jgi:hypothetical protein
MNKRDKIDYLLSLIKEKTEELIDDELFRHDEFTAEELVVACTELVLAESVHKVKYTSPIGRIDVDNVSFMVHDEIAIDISPRGDSYEDED